MVEYTKYANSFIRYYLRRHLADDQEEVAFLGKAIELSQQMVYRSLHCLLATP